MNKPSKHVVPNPSGGWSVKNAGAIRASRTFDRQDQAIVYGRAAAKKNGTVLYVHGRDGSVLDKVVFGHASLSPRLKK